MLEFLIVVIIILWSFGVPQIKEKAYKLKKRSARYNRRRPQDYGAIILDGQVISVRGKGVLDPSTLYTSIKTPGDHR